MNKKQTDLNAVKEMAISFLYLPIEETEYSPIVVQHPIFESAHNISQTDSGISVVNLLEDDKALSETRSRIKQQINECDTLFGVYAIIRKSYRLTFLKYIMPYLSKKDMSELLADAWVSSENPNGDANVSLKTLISWFKKADQTALMTKEDYAIYAALPDIFKVYRGVSIGRNEKGLSYTRSLETAQWFANRFNRDGLHGYVQEAEIKKENAIAYFNTRGEDEIVVDTFSITIHRM